MGVCVDVSVCFWLAVDCEGVVEALWSTVTACVDGDAVACVSIWCPDGAESGESCALLEVPDEVEVLSDVESKVVTDVLCGWTWCPYEV